MKIFKSAFTLAEVLVTLMIIGVIAAMTIPGLRKNAEQRELAAGCKKAYSTLSQAFYLAENENGPMKRWGLTDADSTQVFNNIKEHLNIMKECIGATGCMGDGKYYQLNGEVFTSLTATGYGSPAIAFVLADGMSVAFDIQPDQYYLFFVDVNGAGKKPNTLGQDVYEFLWYPDERGFYPAGKGASAWGNCIEGGTGLDCAARVIQEGGIKY